MNFRLFGLFILLSLMTIGMSSAATLHVDGGLSWGHMRFIGVDENNHADTPLWFGYSFDYEFKGEYKYLEIQAPFGRYEAPIHYGNIYGLKNLDSYPSDHQVNVTLVYGYKDYGFLVDGVVYKPDYCIPQYIPDYL